MVAIGTRPEAIKLSPVISKLQNNASATVRVCATGQHNEMLRHALLDFGIEPDIDMRLMEPNQSLASLSAKLFRAVDEMLDNERPDWLVVQGDTTTAAISAISAFYRRVAVAHVEAGLRSFDKWAPFPEEVNRKICTMVADLHFAPTELAKKNLIADGVHPSQIMVTGNTVIDALFIMREKLAGLSPGVDLKISQALDEFDRMVLITGHRRENFGDGFESICRAIKKLAESHPQVLFLYPVHLNPAVQIPVKSILSTVDNVLLSPPLGYREFVYLLDRCSLVLTDSGGIQEEAPSFGKPVLVMRDVTERPEGVECGVAKLVGTNEDLIVKAVSQLLNDAAAYKAFTNIQNPYGDGRASDKIITALLS